MAGWEVMRRAEGSPSALEAAGVAVQRWAETAVLVVSAVGVFLVLGVAKLLGVDLTESASGREDAEEIERAAADERAPER